MAVINKSQHADATLRGLGRGGTAGEGGKTGGEGRTSCLVFPVALWLGGAGSTYSCSVYRVIPTQAPIHTCLAVIRRAVSFSVSVLETCGVCACAHREEPGSAYTAFRFEGEEENEKEEDGVKLKK